jgi:hypothetical protein
LINIQELAAAVDSQIRVLLGDEEAVGSQYVTLLVLDGDKRTGWLSHSLIVSFTPLVVGVFNDAILSFEFCFCSLSDCVSNDEVGMSWHQVEKKAYEYGELSGADIAFFIYLDLIAMGKKSWVF